VADGCLVDRYARHVRYLRISLTDRCNLRCVYCLPAHGVVWKPKDSILSYEAIEQIVSVGLLHGLRKVRLTGGEPLVRHGVVDLVDRLHQRGVPEICLTSNGLLFASQAAALQQAGLARVNLSLDTLDPDKFRAITRGGDIAKVHAAIDAALEHGLRPRLNVVAMRGFNATELPAFAELTRTRPLDVRFIELMPFGDGYASCEGRDIAGLTVSEMAAAIGPALPAADQPDNSAACGPAVYSRFPDAPGRVGFIAAMHQHICGACNRVRLTADGLLRPCLLRSESVPVREAAEAGDEAAIEAAFGRLMQLKPEHGMRHVGRTEPMAAVGG
jgi:cyclic pyranopterin phosphate synthase